jgi:hypothetical protein
MNQQLTLKNSQLNQLTVSLNTRRNATITGLFFIAATTFAIIGLLLYDPLLNHTDYLTRGSAQATKIMSGAIAELVLVAANTGTALMLYPYLRLYSKHLGLAYFCFRLLEVVFISIGIISMLALLSLSIDYTANASQADIKAYQTIGYLLKAIHDWTFIIGPHFMLGINTFVYSAIFYKTKMVPRKLSVLGIIGALLVFTVGNLAILNILPYHSLTAIILILPIAFYEMILAGWLIVKGFNFEELIVKQHPLNLL